MTFCVTFKERASLIHLLDGLSNDPVADYSQINSELSFFDPNLAKKPQIVALNKIDQPEVQERP
jgi:GTP-binding protein